MKVYLCHHCGEINRLECLECRHCHKRNKAPTVAEIRRISKQEAEQVGLGKVRA